MVQPAQWLIGHSWYLTAEKATDSLVEGNSSLPPGLWLIPSVGGLPGWLRSTVGGTPVFGRRPCPTLDLQPTGDHYVGKPSATGQPTRPTQPFVLPGSINE